MDSAEQRIELLEKQVRVLGRELLKERSRVDELVRCHLALIERLEKQENLQGKRMKVLSKDYSRVLQTVYASPKRTELPHKVGFYRE